MIELIIFIIIIITVSILLIPRCRKTEQLTLIDEVVVKSPSCSSCSRGAKQTKKFAIGDMKPMGNEYDPTSPKRIKIQAPDGQLSTIVTKPDHTNLQGRPWQDFHPTSGQSVFAPGITPVWGLQNSFENAPVRACGRATVPVRNQPCSSGVVQQLARLYYGK